MTQPKVPAMQWLGVNQIQPHCRIRVQSASVHLPGAEIRMIECKSRGLVEWGGTNFLPCIRGVLRADVK